MMYIEHTNLEDNLHQILTNRVPTSSSASDATAAVAASALLARVREAHNSASSSLQHILQQNSSSSPNDQFQHLGNNSTPKTAAKDWIRRPEPKLLPLDHFNSDDITQELHRVQATAKNTSAHNTAENKKQQVLEAQQQLRKQVDEEGEEEQYELLQVIDSDQTAQAETSKPLKVEKNVQQEEIDENFANTSHFVIELKDGQKIASKVATLQPQQRIQVDEDDEFEYVVTRVPKRKLTVNQTIEDYSILNRKVRRPVPEAIPIVAQLKPSSSYNYHSTATRPPALVAAPQLRRLIPNLRNYNSHREINGYATAAAVYIEDDNNCNYHSDSETVEVASTGCPVYAYNNEFHSRQEAQMGLDIINKLKYLFNWNPSTNHHSTVHQEGKRKRRSDDWCAGETIGPQQIKYRKVENRFPKYIAARSEEDDVNEFLPPLSRYSNQQKSPKYDQQILLSNSAQSSRTLLEMSNRRTSSSPTDKPPLRKSIFSAPQITQQLIKNTTYADVEFSDDDEPILIKGFNIKPSTLGSAKRVPEVFNIPILRTDERRKSTQQRPPPPPLIEPSTGSILQSSLIPELETRRKPTYAETLRQSAGTGHVLGGRSSISSSVASTSESSRMLNGLFSLRTNHYSAQNRPSILNQEKQREDCEKYQQLLEQVVPGLYTSAGAENKPCSSSSLKSAAQRRRTGLLLGTAVASSARSSPAPNRRSMGLGQSVFKRPALSSTINLDDDDADEDVTITGISHLKASRSLKNKHSIPGIVIVDDDEISDILDLGNEERHVLSACAKIQKEQNSIISLCEEKVEKPKNDALPYVEPVNSLQERFNASPFIRGNWIESFQTKWSQLKKNRHDKVKEAVKINEKVTAERRAAEAEIQERLRKFQIVDPELLVVDDFVIEEPEFVEFSQDHRSRINAAICGPLNHVLISKFNLNITRSDIHTLCGHNWLNDAVINFYMNLLTERGEKKHDHGLPRVYAMNTFFVPRLLQAGHDGVKRWTRKVDIFAMDIIPVPVHVGNVHWCMAIIHLKNRTIKYYDSMGTANPTVLKALEQYLKDESKDKRKQTFDTSNFVIESVQGVPRQMNGSDCGVFSCMFAEYITRNREITFSQQNMEYFRQKMVLEIVMGELLQ